jgi:hypothetical protein
MKKLFIAIGVAAFMALTPVAALAAPFSDLPETHWAYEAVMSAAEKGIVDGYPDGAFGPSGIVTYGEFIKMAYNARGGGETAPAPDGDWALPYYDAAIGEEMFNRYEISDSLLGYAIPRQHMALILSRCLGSAETPDSNGLTAGISDISVTSPNSYEIVKVYAAGLITGYPDGTFRPGGTLTRAEAATVIDRFINPEKRQLPDLRPAGEKTPLERLSEVSEGDTNPLLGVAEASASARPISELVDDALFNAIGESLLYYEIFEDFPHQMKKIPNRAGRETLAVGFTGITGYLIRDRKAIAAIEHGKTAEGEGTVYVASGEGESARTYPDFDYIAVQPANGNVALLIPNNLR